MGILLAGMIVMTFTVLALGVFLFGYALWCTGLPRRTLIAHIVRHSLVVVGVWIVALGFVWLVTGCGYNPITALQSATRNQAVLAAGVDLPGILHTLPWNLWDLAMGTGWILFPLAILGLLRSWKQRGAHDLLTRTMILCLAMPIVLGLTGLFPVETSGCGTFSFRCFFFR